MTGKTRYTRTANGAIGRIVDGGATEWVSYIRFVGDRADAIAWGAAVDAVTGLDARTFRAVQNFNRGRKLAVVGRNGAV